MEPRELLERQVAVVATLGKLVAIATTPYRGMLLGGSPRSLHEALGTFIGHLSGTLGCCSVTSWPGSSVTSWRRGNVTPLGHLDVNSLNRFTSLLGLCGATLGRHDRVTTLGQVLANPEATWADVRAAASTWRESVDSLMDSRSRRVEEATRLCNEWEVTATMRGRRAETPLGLLERLVAECDGATAFPRELQRRLGDIEFALEETREPCPDFRVALVAAVAEAERLRDASTHLASCHLEAILGQIRGILNSFVCGPDGPAARVVAERCQKAIEDIPRLLREL
ncbi:uncharacterized protein LOC131570272 [Ammospiza caudacuta]|uniref:uncharacterized protein LOC131570272 n=1 Tax=Ammospiza caudacuta TaxID=2857398 RepID=UPI002738B935|nr:uncharacterized protein LOC131570272 [Ammospiza caudacuta]